jgi:hypothetical protein
MADERLDDGMIEIGDPTEEPTLVEPEPKVVIEYHERGGVPWMLIPPLLVLSAVGSILLYNKLAPRPVPHRPPSLAKAVDIARPLPDEPEPAVPRASDPAAVISNPDPKPEPAASPLTPAPKPDESVVPPPPPVEPVPEPVKAAEPVPFPRVEGLGFDPKALEAEQRKVEAPSDAALAPVAREPLPDDRDLPREIDPDLLPPDPRQAKLRQQQRKMEIFQRVEDERYRFHAELKVICRKYRESSGPYIKEMMKQYHVQVDEGAKRVAIELLGTTGRFAGADRRTRIELLRALGFPEPVILDNLFVSYEKHWRINEPGGPRDDDEAFYHTSLFLLSTPPRQSPPTTKAVSAPGEVRGPAR